MKTADFQIKNPRIIALLRLSLLGLGNLKYLTLGIVYL